MVLDNVAVATRPVSDVLVGGWVVPWLMNNRLRVHVLSDLHMRFLVLVKASIILYCICVPSRPVSKITSMLGIVRPVAIVGLQLVRRVRRIVHMRILLAIFSAQVKVSHFI